MNWVAAILAFMKALPEIIKAVKEVLKFISDAVDSFDKKKKAEEFSKALKEARESKDTSRLEDMFGIQRAEPIQIETKSVSQTGLSLSFTKVVTPEPTEKKSLDDVPNLGEAKKESSRSSSILLSLKPSDRSSGGFSLFGFGGGGAASGSEIEGSGVMHTKIGPNTARISSRFIPIIIMFILVACRSVPNQPNYKPKLFAGDSSRAQIVRKQSNEYLSCTDPEFDRYIALKDSALQCLYETYILNCQSYKKAVVPCEDVDLKRIDKELRRNGVR